MTIYKPLRTLAQGAAELAVKLANRKPVIARGSVNNGTTDVPAVLFDVVTVDRNNIVSTVVADGQASFDDVYRGIPEAARPKRP
jgi:D-xylose transport system substrate-binding protein